MTGDQRHRDYDALRDDLAAYALGALPADEAAGLEEHLVECRRCRELMRWLSPAVDVLPAAVPQLVPPDSLRDSVMSVVRRESAEPLGGTAESPDRVAAAETSRPGRGWRRWRVGVALRPATALALAAVLAAGVAGGYALRGDQGADGPQSTFVEARALGGNPDVSATLERRGDAATLHVHELPDLPPSEVYEVWIERAGVMEPSSLFVLSENRSGVAAVPGPLEGAERVLVTAEPSGGSREPTGPPLLAAPLH